jgi:hypothetical protein
MKTLKILLLQSIACLIITSYSIGQSTLTVAGGGKMNITPGTTVQQQNLDIGSGSQLVNWGDLTVNGVLANNAGTPGLILKADENGYGSLMHLTGNIPATSEQYLVSERWHLVTPGLTGETIEPYENTYFKTWHENDGTWEYLVLPMTIPIEASVGYSVWTSDAYTGTKTVSLEGNLLAGDIAATGLSYTPGSPQLGYNLVGNPYPSSIDWDGSWSMNNIGGWAVVYDNGTFKGWNPFLSGDDRSYNGKTDGLIAPRQAFWIRATAANPTLTFKQNSRSHGEVPFYKDDKYVKSYAGLHLIASANEYTDEMAILFMEEGTLGFDELYELEKHYNIIQAPTIYSVPATEAPTAFNVLPEDWIEESEQPIIPVGFELEEGVTCTISSTGLDSFDPYTTIYLEDLVGGVMHDLKTGDYSFISVNPENPDRFLLHFESTVDLEENGITAVQIYSYNKFVYIKAALSTEGKATIYDLMGREIISFDVQGGLTKKHVFDSGYYIVKVLSNEEITTKKVYIK